MIKAIKKFFKFIYWVLYTQTPKGKKENIMDTAFQNISASNSAKFSVIGTANKLLRSKKILAFHKGKSISKSKRSNYEVIKQSKTKHDAELDNVGVKLSKSGKFQNA
ncbi:hypothetical protein [Lacinutrix sp. Hel_I_90]|uniref:hypothetical protein n=1 Tax=Lacinutrix sp. Hel_I_90 TaxID=1249999 RepID=UPI0005C8952D|nr:hypothetical protein [Lacinutrix sp. Hel_I_90]